MGVFASLNDAEKSFYDSYDFIKNISIKQQQPYRWNIFEGDTSIGTIERISFYDGYTKF